MWHDSLLRASDINLAAEGILLYTFSRLASNVNEKKLSKTNDK